MRWVRTNRRSGAWWALLAMAIQIIVSFGHAHRIEGFRQGALSPQATAGIYNQLTDDPGDPASKPVRLGFDYCAICVVINMGASMMPADAPAPAPDPEEKITMTRAELDRLIAERESQSRNDPSPPT